MFDPFETITKWYKNLSKTGRQLLFLMLVSFLVRIIYVFCLTKYETYLFSDAARYWKDAISRYNGEAFHYSQWASWAPFFHYYLAFIFEVADLVNLSSHKLELVLLLGIILSVVSIYFFYRIATHFIKDNTYSFLATFFYAFSYPFIYLNTFVLSENLAIPLLIISTSLLLSNINYKRWVFLSGLFLALGICTRPALGLLVLPFLLYVIFHNNKASFVKGLIFAIGFFLVTSLTIQENIRISNGNLKALAANGGVNFFIQHCKVSKVRSHYANQSLDLKPPVFIRYPELAKMNFQTNEPFYKQGYFYRLGFDCIKKEQGIWVENFISLKTLFTGPLFPSILSCFGFKFLKVIWDYIIIFMTPSLFVFYFLIRDKIVELKKSIFLLSIPFVSILMNYFFIPGQRQFIPAYFVIYICFFAFISNLKKYSNLAVIYFALGFVFSFLRGIKL